MIPRAVYVANKDYMESAIAALVRQISGRRRVWKSRVDARDWLVKRPPWKAWDRRILELFIVRVLSLRGDDGSIL